MVILGGAGPVHEIGREAFQEVDQVGIMEPMMKWVHQTTQAARYPEVVSMAFRKATTGRPGPVYIDCGADVLYEEVDEDAAITPYRAERRSRPAAEADVVRETIDMLAASEKPMIFAGGGAFFSGAADELAAFVDLTSTPFYTAPMSRGLVPEDHAVSFQAARSTAMRETDFVLVVGTRLNWMVQYGHRFNRDAKVVQIDIDAAELGHNRDIDLGVVGDAKTVMGQLLAEARNREADWGGRLESDWINNLREVEDSRTSRSAALLDSDQRPMHPLRLCKEIREFLDRDAIVSVDGNEILHFGRQSIPTFVPGHRLNSGVTGTMGVGLPYGIGAQLAKPDKQVLVLHGDGSMGMNAMELDTCVRHNIPVVTVISNNAGWTARTPDRRKPGRELGFTNFDGMARELGAYGEKVEDPNEIKPALQRAFDSGKPAVINAIVEPTAAGVSRAWGGSRME